MLGNILIPPAHALPILVLMRPDSDTNFAFAFLAFAQHASIFASSPERKNKPRETCDVAVTVPINSKTILRIEN
jgi:hypothetical protein